MPLENHMRLAAATDKTWLRRTCGDLELHPVPGGRTALYVLAGPLYRLSGQQRFCNLLDRAGFAWAEEVAATPEVCLLELRNSGPKFIAAVRRAVSELGIDDASPSPQGTGQRRDPGQAPSPPAVPAEVAKALYLVARLGGCRTRCQRVRGPAHPRARHHRSAA
jgi:hypothetical protein